MKSKTARSIILEYISQHKTSFFLGILSMALCGTMQVYTPKIIGYFVDWLRGTPLPPLIQRESKEQTFFVLLIVFVISHLLLMVGRIGWRLTFARDSHIASRWLKDSIWIRASHFPRTVFNRAFNLGSLMNTSTSDVNSARMIFGMTLVSFFDIIFISSFSFIAMYAMAPTMTLWLFAIFLILPPFVIKLTNLESKNYEQAQDALSDLNQKCSQSVATIRLQRLTQTEDKWRAILSKAADFTRLKQYQTANTSFLFLPLMGMTTVVCYLVMFGLGIQRVSNGQMSVGEFIAFQSLVLLIQDPLLEIGSVVSEWQKGLTGLRRIITLLEAPTDHTFQEVPLLPVVKYQGPFLEIDNLSYCYPGQNSAVINNISIDLMKGERLGILGPIGSGKTTLLNLISRQLHHYQGKIALDGRLITSYSHYDFMKKIGFVPQKPFLFADSIRYNLSLEEDYHDELIWKVLEISGIKNEIESLPDKLDTQLGEYGVNLSGGQKQRLTLARALLKKPELLLLDDCLSAVDAITEDHILKMIDEHYPDTTMIWVAHRQSTLKYCHKRLEVGQHV